MTLLNDQRTRVCIRGRVPSWPEVSTKPASIGPPLTRNSSSLARGCVCGGFVPHGNSSNRTTVMPCDLQTPKLVHFSLKKTWPPPNRSIVLKQQVGGRSRECRWSGIIPADWSHSKSPWRQIQCSALKIFPKSITKKIIQTQYFSCKKKKKKKNGDHSQDQQQMVTN
jgi:hypothetical protein